MKYINNHRVLTNILYLYYFLNSKINMFMTIDLRNTDRLMFFPRVNIDFFSLSQVYSKVNTVIQNSSFQMYAILIQIYKHKDDTYLPNIISYFLY